MTTGYSERSVGLARVTCRRQLLEKGAHLALIEYGVHGGTEWSEESLFSHSIGTAVCKDRLHSCSAASCIWV